MGNIEGPARNRIISIKYRMRDRVRVNDVGTKYHYCTGEIVDLLDDIENYVMVKMDHEKDRYDYEPRPIRVDKLIFIRSTGHGD